MSVSNDPGDHASYRTYDHHMIVVLCNNISGSRYTKVAERLLPRVLFRQLGTVQLCTARHVMWAYTLPLTLLAIVW